MGQLNAYSGGQSGADSKSVRSITFDKLAPGIYKVTSKEDLANGEYRLLLRREFDDGGLRCRPQRR